MPLLDSVRGHGRHQIRAGELQGAGRIPMEWHQESSGQQEHGNHRTAQNDLRQDGAPLDGQSLTRYEYRRLLAQAGLPQLHFHELRHTFATLMAEHGPEHGVGLKDVSAMLGHSTTAITADLYTHVTTGMRRRVANAAEAIVGRRGPSN
jgi:integrase